MPHTLRFLAHPSRNPRPAAKQVAVANQGGGTLAPIQFQVDYRQGGNWLHVEPQGTGNSQTLLLSVDARKLTAKHGLYRALVAVSAEGALNSPQAFAVELTTARWAAGSEATVDNLDGACHASPWFWVAPRFHGPWPPGYRDTYLVGAGPADQDAWVRFQPELAAGRYEVGFDPAAPFRPTDQVDADIRFNVRVRHSQGTDVIPMQPLQSRTIGTFPFREGNEGYVQIEARGATGLIVADAVRFQRVAPHTEPHAPDAPAR